MSINRRRQFIGGVSKGILGGLLGQLGATEASGHLPDNGDDEDTGRVNGQFGILFDATRCIGCMACVRLCKEEHGLPPDLEPNLSARSLTVVQKKNGYFMRRLCMHCLTPSCVSVCPVGALEKTDTGAVIWHEKRCIGCRYCMMACPFNVPTYEWWSRNPRVVKCDMCQHRLKEGREIACSWVCPLGATSFGLRNDLLREAHRRIRTQNGSYLDHVYGETEVGGTSTLYLLPVVSADFGLPVDLTEKALPDLTWEVMRKIPYVIGTGAVLLGGIWWIINRRIELEQVRHELDQEKKRERDQ